MLGRQRLSKILSETKLVMAGSNAARWVNGKERCSIRLSFVKGESDYNVDRWNIFTEFFATFGIYTQIEKYIATKYLIKLHIKYNPLFDGCFKSSRIVVPRYTEMFEND